MNAARATPDSSKPSDPSVLGAAVPRDDPSHRFVRHARVFAALTLVSRVLGLARDALITRVLGVTPAATAFNIAFQFPNTFRRLFGEGALSAAFIPEYARLLREDPKLADRFASLNVGLLTLVLSAIVIVLEALIAIAIGSGSAGAMEEWRLALVATAIMLPYAPLVCTTALLGGVLQTRGRFAAQAGAPILLNFCMIGAGWLWGYLLHADAHGTAMAVAWSVALAGVLQVAWCLFDLRHLVSWTRSAEGTREATRRMLRRMGPVAVGLGAVQIATLIESWLLVGWPLHFGSTILGHDYPLDASAGAVLLNAQRLYQFPLGVFGIALATAVFPLLAKQAHDAPAFVSTLRRGMRLSLLVGLPATAGLMLVADDLTSVIYLGKRVTIEDTRRMAWVLLMYSAVVGTYSLTHVVTRAYYAKGDTRTPTKVSVTTVGLSLILSTALMLPFAEAGLALASSIAAAAQLAMLLAMARRRLGDGGAHHPFDAGTVRAGGVIVVGTILMSAAVIGARFALAALGFAGESWTSAAARLAIETLVGLAAYAIWALRMNREEIHWLRERA
ncbi:MAG TPA: murein biosynthesis integral membrane protein MurJ [Phycisphaerales bacterium]|nr:murein biosynthesis integral membrane protein MurJ [Phycisphaerales bacterium]